MNLQEQWQRSISGLHSYSTAGEETFRNQASLSTLCLRGSISVLYQLRVLVFWFFPSLVISWKQPRKAIKNNIFQVSHSDLLCGEKISESVLVNGGDWYERDGTRWNLSLLLQQRSVDRPASTSVPTVHRKLFICQHCLLLENKARVC